MVLGLRMNKLLGKQNENGGNPDELKTADFFTGTKNCVSGEWNPLGTYIVGAQQKVKFGHGSLNNYPANQGYAYVFIKDDAGTPVEVPGKVRFVRSNAQEKNLDFVLEKEEGVMHGSKTDLNQRLALPLQNHEAAGEDDKLMIQFKPDTTANVVANNCDIIISVTRY